MAEDLVCIGECVYVANLFGRIHLQKRALKRFGSAKVASARGRRED
jgi:hypothetical protein